jgi:hypothetical protein
MLNIPEYKEYAGETKIALMDNSSLAFMHELSHLMESSAYTI